jgi:glycosyltransferase involved in cell wall biosynthesis
MLQQASILDAPPPRTSAVRVLFALPGMHRVTRGAEVALEELAGQIARRPGFEVTVIGSGPDRPEAPYRYRRASCIPRERFERWPRVPYLRDHYAYEELSFAPGLRRAFVPRDFDITVTCGFPYTSWVLRAGSGGARAGHRPMHVYVTQNGDWMVHAGNWEYRYFSCDALVCTNPEYFERNRTRFPSALIPNGVDPDRFFPGPAARGSLGLPADAPVVLMVSALTPFKRVLEGIRSVALVPGVHLAIAGDGELRREVQSMGSAMLPGRFSLLTLPRARMPELYRSADVFLHMSQDEPSANAYIEALASGLPIVTHDRHVTRWTLEDQAVLVDTSDVRAVAEAIGRAMELREPGHVQGRVRLVQRRFAWSAIAEHYCSFFQSILERE